jgi:hypothetical protein
MSYVLLALAVVAALHELLYAFRFKDWRPFAASLTAGFIAVVLSFFVFSTFLDAHPALLLWAGCAGCLCCVLWRIAHNNSWNRVWDTFVRFMGEVHFWVGAVMAALFLLVVVLAFLKTFAHLL